MGYFVGKDLKKAKKVRHLMAQRAAYLIMSGTYFSQASLVMLDGEMANYGKVDATGAPIEMLYEYSLEGLEGTDDSYQVVEFVADQYAVMKQKFENDSIKVGNIARLAPQRATIRGDELYSNHFDGLVDVFSEDLFSSEAGRKTVTFHDFCKRFIRFIRLTRGVENHRGLPVSKSLFYMNASAPPNVSGLVIDFETQDYHDDAKKQMLWMEDPNFDLYCSAANYAGFYVDKRHPYRIIANVAHSKMQRAAEYTGGSVYSPGSASNIFQKYYFKTCLHEFLVMKNKLFVTWTQIAFNRSIIKKPTYCKSGKLITRNTDREWLKLEHLIVPPIPGRDRLSPDQAFGATPAESYKNRFSVNDSSVTYGLHCKKYGLIYWLKFYVEVRYHEIAEIKDFLTEKQKNDIVKQAIKLIKTGNISRAFELVGAAFDPWAAILNH